MNWQLAVACGGAFLGSLALTDTYVSSEASNWNAKLTNPPQTTIILPTYNEETWIERALQSLTAQNVYLAYPDRFELIVADSQSTDHTAEIARNYTRNVLSMPPGKLNAKHLAILDANGEIIVSVDADCYYPPNFLNLLLKPFEDPNVVAVGGCTQPEVGNPILKTGYLMQIWLYTLTQNTLIGRASAFRKDVYLQTGGYRLTFNQTDVAQVQHYEEVELTQRLRKLGKVVFNPKAVVYHSPRMFYCELRPKIIPTLRNGVYATYCGEIERGERM